MGVPGESCWCPADGIVYVIASSPSPHEGIKGKKLYLIEYSVSVRRGFEL